MFALNIEAARPGNLAGLIHPNHLAFNLLGYAVYSPLHAAFHTLRSLPVLQGLNIAASLLTIALLGRMLLRITGDAYSTAALTALFAFGATWWKFSVDSDAYIIAVLCLLVSARALIWQKHNPLVTAGVFHCAAMLLHQLSVFFLPAVWIAILCDRRESLRRRLTRCAVYTGATAAITMLFYYAGYVFSDGEARYRTFSAWLASHSDDSSFSFYPLYILSGTTKSYLQLLFGGRVRLFREFLEPWTIAILAVLCLLIGILLWRVWQGRGDFKLFTAIRRSDLWSSSAFRVAAAWFLSYALFLLIWLPRNTFYKLFLWPAVLIIVACVLQRLRSLGLLRRNRLALFVAVQFCWNLIFFVYPYSKTRANLPLDFGEHFSRAAPPNATVLFKEFNTDNWTIRYASPQTIWRPLLCTGHDCVTEIEAELKSGPLWLEGTAMHYLEVSSPETRQWIQEQRGQGRVSECCGAQWPARFYRLSR